MSYNVLRNLRPPAQPLPRYAPSPMLPGLRAIGFPDAAEGLASRGGDRCHRRVLDAPLERDDVEPLAHALDPAVTSRRSSNRERARILQRESQVVAAERALEQARIELSIYLRDEAGEPILVEDARLPSDLPRPAPLPPGKLAEDLVLTEKRRPEARRFAVLIAQNEVAQLKVDALAEFHRAAAYVAGRGRDPLVT
jgi:hypothetical protein